MPAFCSKGVEAQKRYTVGIALLLLVVILWTLSNFVTQDLYEDGYEKPFLVTYLNTSAFTLYLLPWIVKAFFSSNISKELESAQGYTHVENYQASTNDDTINLQSPTTSELGAEPIEDLLDLHLKPPLTIHETAKLASAFCVFWFVANWSINASLGFTSVASSTILSSTSGFFTLAVGRIFRVETLSVSKLCALCISFIGVVLVSTSDNSASVTPPEDVLGSTMALLPGSRIFGDMLALLGAAFYALYVILLKVQVQEEYRLDMQLFFGFVGFFNIIFLFPVGILLHLNGLEPFEFPHSRRAWVALVLNMIITLSSDYIYVLAMLKTTPLLVTIGLSLTIPLALVGDYFLHIPSTIQAVFGAVWIILGFIIIGLENSKVVAVTNVETAEDVSSAAYRQNCTTCGAINDCHHLT